MPLSSSGANMLPMVLSDAAIYSFIALFLLGGINTEGFVKYPLISSKAF
jgi:hypothetical protein